MSWIGDTETVAKFLLEVGADKDPEKGFHLSEGFLVFGIGNKEVVVPDHVKYFVKGKGHYLAEDLVTLGAGVAVAIY